jgi:hypothetical protein
MTSIITWLSPINLLALTAAFAVGLLSHFTGPILVVGNWPFLSWPYLTGQPEQGAPTLHFYLGLTTVLSTLALHCLVFIYLLGTGRWVKEVALAYRLPDAPLPKLTRDLKRRTFPVALLAMLVPIATAAAGGGQNQGWPWQIHLGLGCATLLVNLWAFRVERRNVTINTSVLGDVMREVDRIRAEHGLPSNAEALRQAGPPA